MSYYTFFYPKRGYNNPNNDSVNVINSRKHRQALDLEKYKALISAMMIDAFNSPTDNLDRIYDKLSFYVNCYAYSKDSIEKDDWALAIESLFKEAEKDKKDKVDYAVNHFRYDDGYDLDEVIENYESNISYQVTQLLILCRIKPSKETDVEEYLSSDYINKINDIIDSIDEEIDEYNSCKFYKEFWSTKKDESELYEEETKASNDVKDNNGFEYVDLGLPSGTLWATMNVGASKPSDYGLYFQWGDTAGYTKDQIGIGKGKKKFAWDDYKWSINGSDENFSKYATKGSKLELEDDAAHVNMGGDWHMPTPKQIKELIDNTTSIWTSLDGVDGRLLTSKKDTSKSIFFPAAGNAWIGSVEGIGNYGSIWSSMLSEFYVNYGTFFDAFSGNDYINAINRRNGLSVRGVIDKNYDDSNRKKRNMEAKEKLNLVEILKDAPKGTKLWSPLYGECELKYVNIEASNYPINCTTKDHKGDTTYVMFTANGKSSNNFYYSECMLFPSKDNRDWSTFKTPKKHKSFKPF